MYKFTPQGVANEMPPSKHPMKPASTSSSTPRICLYNARFEEDVKLKGFAIPKDQLFTFYTNGDIEYRDNDGHVIRCENIGCEITIADVESLGKVFLQ